MWLQHNSHATPDDADIVIEATGQVIGTFAKLIRRREYGEPEQCPRYESYRLRDNVEVDDGQMGFWESEVCASCGWQSEPVFTSYQDHFEGADLAAYLAGPGIGVSDRRDRSSGKPLIHGRPTPTG